MTRDEFLRAFASGQRDFAGVLTDLETDIYCGSLSAGDVGPIGTASRDDNEGVIVLRVAERDASFPCGYDCCGTEVHALRCVPLD